MDKLFQCSLIFGIISCVLASINITELDVPGSIELGTTDEIILDCNFEIDKDEESLEIKWFFNGDIQQIYQWIPESKTHGFGMGPLKDRLDLTYNATDDVNTMYRALKIRNITHDLSGNYTCKVSSFRNEDTETKQLIIYSPAKSGLDIFLFKNEALVMCTVSGIYPLPHMDFFIKSENGSRTDVNEDIAAEVDQDGFYKVTARHYFDNLTLPDLTIFVCNLSIPGTDYALSKTLEMAHEQTSTENSTALTDHEEDYITGLSTESNLTNAEHVDDNNKGRSRGMDLSCNLPVILSLLLVFLLSNKKFS